MVNIDQSLSYFILIFIILILIFLGYELGYNLRDLNLMAGSLDLYCTTLFLEFIFR